MGGEAAVVLLTAISVLIHVVQKVRWHGAGRAVEVDLGQEWGLVLFDYCQCPPWMLNLDTVPVLSRAQPMFL